MFNLSMLFYKRGGNKMDAAQKETQYLVMETLYHSYYEYFKRKLDDMDTEDSVDVICKGDFEKLSYWLVSVHEFLNVQLHYIMGDEKEYFTDFQSIFDYFEKLVLGEEVKLGID